MKRKRLRGKIPSLKPRIGVLPTRAERDRTIYTRKTKHKGSLTRDGDHLAVGIQASILGTMIPYHLQGGQQAMGRCG